MTDMKGISRSGNGYTVRIYRNGKSSSTSFSDSKYGGQEGALRAAISFRDKAEAEIPQTKKQQKIKKDGLPEGVTKTFPTGSTGFPTPCYLVTWGFPIRHKKEFRYNEADPASEEDARKQAIALRNKIDGVE